MGVAEDGGVCFLLCDVWVHSMFMRPPYMMSLVGDELLIVPIL